MTELKKIITLRIKNLKILDGMASVITFGKNGLLICIPLPTKETQKALKEMLENGIK